MFLRCNIEFLDRTTCTFVMRSSCSVSGCSLHFVKLILYCFMFISIQVNFLLVMKKISGLIHFMHFVLVTDV